MNGAESLVRTLVSGGVDICFTNPGTSEMHFVAALDRVDGMRPVLTLYEGVATAAADGFARMTGRPATTLLHLGPGLANGLSNIHNASKASTPIINIVGDQATYHRKYEAPLTSDIEGAARPFSNWVHTSPSAKAVASDGARAVAEALTPPGKVATLILPADTAWGEGTEPAAVPAVEGRKKVDQAAVRQAAEVLRSGEPALIVLAGPALFQKSLDDAGRIAATTGARIMAQTFNSRMQRGAGRVAIDRIPYVVDQAVAALAKFKHIILVGSRVPIATFAYPDKPSELAPVGARFHVLARQNEDMVHALEWLADEVTGDTKQAETNRFSPPPLADGEITLTKLGQSFGALVPENGIVVDEGISAVRGFLQYTHNAHPHDWLQSMGGSIGIGLPLSVGAAVACPDRPVVTLEGDGSAMYTIQALWTQARESLNIKTIIFNNRSYAVLRTELHNVGAMNIGRKALDMIDLGRPNINFVALAKSMGVSGRRVETMGEFNKALTHALSEKGPSLIEVIVPN